MTIGIVAHGLAPDSPSCAPGSALAQIFIKLAMAREVMIFMVSLFLRGDLLVRARSHSFTPAAAGLSGRKARRE
jgi:hypothetical protein